MRSRAPGIAPAGNAVVSNRSLGAAIAASRTSGIMNLSMKNLTEASSGAPCYQSSRGLRHRSPHVHSQHLDANSSNCLVLAAVQRKMTPSSM